MDNFYSNTLILLISKIKVVKSIKFYEKINKY